MDFPPALNPTEHFGNRRLRLRYSELQKSLPSHRLCCVLLKLIKESDAKWIFRLLRIFLCFVDKFREIRCSTWQGNQRTFTGSALSFQKTCATQRLRRVSEHNAGNFKAMHESYHEPSQFATFHSTLILWYAPDRFNGTLMLFFTQLQRTFFFHFRCERKMLWLR